MLFKILEKLNFSWAPNYLHLSYGMVELPEGKMKSREGTEVDADELIRSVIDEAKFLTSERGYLKNLLILKFMIFVKKLELQVEIFFIESRSKEKNVI